MSSTSAPMKPLAPISRAACIGGGVIGGGWIARFLLAGIDVRVFDPHPEAERIVSEVIANAERAYGLLTEAPLPARGRLTFSPHLADAVSGAAWVQESVPERLDLKRRVLAEIDATCPVDALIGWSTSGLLPTELQAGLAIRSGCLSPTHTIRFTSCRWWRSPAARRRPRRPSSTPAPFLTPSA